MVVETFKLGNQVSSVTQRDLIVGILKEYGSVNVGEKWITVKTSVKAIRVVDEVREKLKEANVDRPVVLLDKYTISVPVTPKEEALHIFINPDKRGLEVCVGDSYKVKDELKGLKFTWEPFSKKWCKFIETAEEYESLVESVSKIASERGIAIARMPTSDEVAKGLESVARIRAKLAEESLKALKRAEEIRRQEEELKRKLEEEKKRIIEEHKREISSASAILREAFEKGDLTVFVDVNNRVHVKPTKYLGSDVWKKYNSELVKLGWKYGRGTWEK